ncbi:MAG: polysulfide reductase NrfD [Pseudomonadales bacterium]|jgi:molybdopterin-containing oxidoreductase family membrane subunit|nr:polysulfide reductase NrfD [Pseudomonadales bacterium]MDP7597059.1 polysulfide reductase NrfD [Pseudomonadales bacterium]HJN53189.1 NrfD/PsrC family molybdoenzyme membrane anchor subunit [Pseudomonadales bacterium]|tara:strand:+ start:729 stop:1982 length:1254 start_codon:yes stop_codon:yes gene_type:complete
MSELSQITVGVPSEKRGYPLAVILSGVLFLFLTIWYTTALGSAPSEARWGFLVANFIFLLGISQFGVAFSAIMRICGVKWARPYYRIAELATLAFFPLAIPGFLFIFYYGGAHLFHWLNPPEGEHLSLWLNSTFLLVRNVLAQLVFYIIAVGYFTMGLLPDISEEDSKEGPQWRRAFYRWMLRLKARWGEAALKRGAYFYSPIVLIAAVVAQTFIAWDLAMMLVSHYHSTVFPMLYIVGNMFAGTAALLFLALLLSRLMNLGDYFQTPQVHSISIVLTGFTLLWLYMFWAQFFVSWFGNLEGEYGVLQVQMFGHYAPYFWAMIVCNFAIPLFCLISLTFKRTWWLMLTLAVVINVGVWLNRYIIVVPGLDGDHRPFLSLPEVAMTVGLFAGFLFILLLFLSVFPAISKWELRAAEEI